MDPSKKVAATAPGGATALPTGAWLVATLERWEDAGAHWEVVHRSVRDVTISMCRCDGGEELDRFTSDAPEVLDFLAGRSSSSG